MITSQFQLMPMLFRLTHYTAINDNKSKRTLATRVKTAIYTAVKTSPPNSLQRERQRMLIFPFAHNHNSLRLWSDRYHNSLRFARTFPRPPDWRAAFVRSLQARSLQKQILPTINENRITVQTKSFCALLHQGASSVLVLISYFVFFSPGTWAHVPSLMFGSFSQTNASDPNDNRLLLRSAKNKHINNVINLGKLAVNGATSKSAHLQKSQVV